MNYTDKFIEIYKNYITREGSEKLLEYLMSKTSDFFEAPASTKFHGSYKGGLVEHSVIVYECLSDYLDRSRVKELYNMEYSNETMTIVSLLHDVCKINCYKAGTRNVKDEQGVWHSVPTYDYEDQIPYGHGEKSVYIINGYMKLAREEAFAIRYHMGFSGLEDRRSIADSFEKFPLSFALATADMEATYFIESK